MTCSDSWQDSSQARSQVLGGKIHFKGGRIVAIICSKQNFLGTTKFGEHCPRMSLRGYGPDSSFSEVPRKGYVTSALATLILSPFYLFLCLVIAY